MQTEHLLLRRESRPTQSCDAVINSESETGHTLKEERKSSLPECGRRVRTVLETRARDEDRGKMLKRREVIGRRTASFIPQEEPLIRLNPHTTCAAAIPVERSPRASPPLRLPLHW